MEGICAQDIRAPPLLLLLLLAVLAPLATPSNGGTESGVCLPAAVLPGSRLLRCHTIAKLNLLDRTLQLRGSTTGAFRLRGGGDDDDSFDPLGPEDEVDREALRMLAGDDHREEGEDEALGDEVLEESQSNRRSCAVGYRGHR